MSDWIEDFRRTVDAAAARLSLISETDSAVPLAPGKWSAREVIGHLIDSASHNHQRFVRAQFSDEMVFAGYDQEDWVRVQHYNEASWAELVGLWRLYNLHLERVIRHIPAETRSKSRGRHNLDQIAWQTVAQSEPVTLEYFMRDYVGHLQHHLNQIFQPHTEAQVASTT
jgi:hypothetical protein